MESKDLRIFVVEDNLSDVLLIQEALNARGIQAKLQIAVEGERAMQDLAAMGLADVPHLIIVDLNLPRVNGLQLLRAIRRNLKFTATPVMVLTSSRSSQDRVEAEKLGATAYVSKPGSLDEFLGHVGETIQRLLANRAADAAFRRGARREHRFPTIRRHATPRCARPPAGSRRAARRA